MQGSVSRPAFAQGAMKLKLQNVRQKVARVGNVGGNVIFCARVEVLFLRSRGATP